MGMVCQVIVCRTFDQENNEGSAQWDLRFIRNGSCGENDDGCDEVEKVIIDQGCNQLVKINTLLVSRMDSARNSAKLK